MNCTTDFAVNGPVQFPMCLREIISPKTNMYPKNESLEDDDLLSNK